MAELEKELNNAVDIKKCKRTQFSIPTLTIIFYVFSKIGNIPLPASNDRSAELSNNLRRGRDSNPRYPFEYTHFPGVLLQPLGHLSKNIS
jgi:hypothetical protein